MKTTITIDQAGRIVLPKPLREELHLTAGDSLEAEASGDEITLRPARGRSPLRKKRGVWVHGVGQRLSAATVEEVVRAVRHEREARSLSETP